MQANRRDHHSRAASDPGHSVASAQFDQDEAHRQFAQAREEQMIDLTAQIRDLTADVRDMTRSIRRLTWAAVIIALAALVAAIATAIVTVAPALSGAA